MQHRYRRLRMPSDQVALVSDLHLRLQRREAAELARLQQVVGMIASPDCRSRALAAHFGEDLATDCGHCSACLGDSSAELPARRRSPVAATLTDELQPLLRAHAETLGSSRQLARFLCGCSSPVFTRRKLSRDPNFGRLVEMPFADVLVWAETRSGGGTG
jgi:ATP-dependent DNA helicase RecQ